MDNGIKIEYRNVSPDAKETATVVESTTGLPFDKYYQNLKLDDMELINYGNPIENYQCLLDGNATIIPDDLDEANIAFWGTPAYVCSIIFFWGTDVNLSVPGFTVTFDKFNDIYPKEVEIVYYNKNEFGNWGEGGRKKFYPDSGVFFCDFPIDRFGQVDFYIRGINIPDNYTKIFKIDFGRVIELNGMNIRSAEISQTVDPISCELKTDTFNFTLDTQSRGEIYEFQEQQPLTVYFNNAFRGSMFLTGAQRTSEFSFDIDSEDYKGKMKRKQFRGGRYVNKSAFELLEEIFSSANIPYTIDDSVSDIEVSGWLPYSTVSDAVMQVCFVLKAAVDTSTSAKVLITKFSDNVKQSIPGSRIMTGQTFETNSTVTAVELNYHSYGQSLTRDELYKASESGTGTWIEVKFSQPYTGLTITNGSIEEWGANYAIIHADTEDCVLKGYQLWHTEMTKRKENPLKKPSDADNIVSITSATLVSSKNVDNLLDNCYNWIVNNKTTKCNIVEGKTMVGGVLKNDQPIALGDVLEIDTEYLGTQTKRLISQSFSLNGNILSKECELK